MDKDSSSEGIDTARIIAQQRSDAALAAAYQPALDSYAKRLIARIQRNHRDTDAVVALQAHYQAHSDFPSLANLMEGWGQTLRDDRNAADAFVKGAEAALQLKDHDRAYSLYAQALERFPEHAPALARLEALLMELGQYTDLERTLSSLTRALERRGAEVKLRAEIHYRLGQLYEWRLLLHGRAIPHYKSALELDPTLVPAIVAARGIYSRSGKTQAVADMYELQIAATHEPKQHHALLLALAKHRHEQLDDIDGAVLALRRALKAAPAETAATELLAALLRERGQRNQGKNGHADRARAAELYYQLASEGPRANAPRYLEQCLALQPDHARALTLRGEIDARMSPIPGGPKNAVDDELAAWLDDTDVTLIDEGVTTQNMVPITERPPPPDAPNRRGQRKRFQV